MDEARKILYIQPVGCEGPGLIHEALPAGWTHTVLRPGLGHPFPTDPRAYCGIVVLGGPMSVSETTHYPWMENLIHFVRRCLDADVPVLGVCLGSQVLAVASGANVEPMGFCEIGWFPITLTDAGREDPTMKTLSSPTVVFHWHGDRWELPQGATLLASSEKCDHQVFHLDGRHYGFQCHLEIKPEAPGIWTDAYPSEALQVLGENGIRRLREETSLHYPGLREKAVEVFRSFWRRVAGSGENSDPREPVVRNGIASPSH